MRRTSRPDSLRRRSASARHIVCLAVVLLPALPAPAAAQTADSLQLRVVVDYIAGSTLYVPAGTAAGLQVADTLRAERGGRGIGLLVVAAATATRASLGFVGQPVPVTRGDSLVLRRVGRARTGAAEAVPPGEPGVVPAPAAAAASRIDHARPPEPLRLDGVMSAAVEGSRSRSSWDGPGSPQRVTRTWLPTARLHADVTGLPGGLRAGVRARGSWLSGVTPVDRSGSDVTVHELFVERRFDRLPFQVRAGRLVEPALPFAGAWDGASLRVGSRDLALGLVAGYAPRTVGGTPAMEERRLGAFAIHRVEHASVRHDLELGLVEERLADAGPNRSLSGWERLALGPLYLVGSADYRLTPRSELVAASAAADLSIGAGLSVRAGLGVDRPPFQLLTGTAGASHRRTFHVGGAWAGSGAYLSLQHARSSTDSATARAWDAFGSAPLPFGLAVDAAGSWWRQGEDDWLNLAPALRARLGRVSVRAGYRLQRTSFGTLSATTHGGDLSVRAPLPGRVQLRVHGSIESGDGLTLVRFGSGLWIAF